MFYDGGLFSDNNDLSSKSFKSSLVTCVGSNSEICISTKSYMGNQNDAKLKRFALESNNNMNNILLLKKR